jgi:predicted nucleic acid-binding protein
MRIVDCSFALKWCFEEEGSAEARAVLYDLAAEGILVPALWIYEICNALRSAIRRGHLTSDQAKVFLAELHALRLEVAALAPSDFQRLLSLAVSAGLTAYDAAYLDLAMRTRHSLVTADAALRSAAQRYGVTVC